MLIAPGFHLHEDAITVRFVRASGPGGQKVNKVSSAVELRLDLARMGWFEEGFLARLSEAAGRRLNNEGVLVIRADRLRSQDGNRADAMARLAELLREAFTPPKARRPTRKPPRADRARLDAKKRRADVKGARRSIDPNA